MNEEHYIILIIAFIVGAVLSKLSSSKSILKNLDLIFEKHKEMLLLVDTQKHLHSQIDIQENLLKEKSKSLEKINERYNFIKNSHEYKDIDKLQKLKESIMKLKKHQDLFSLGVIISMYQELYSIHFEEEVSLLDISNLMKEYSGSDDDNPQEVRKLDKKREALMRSMEMKL